MSLMLNLEAIPQELKSFRAWVVWRSVTEQGAFKPTKKPYSALTGRLCDPTDASQWATFEQACAVSARYDGLGFCLSPADPYTVIDLDNPACDAQGQPLDEAEAREITEQHNEAVNRFGSYTEISPSGKGVHIWIRGNVPCGRRRNKVEIYSDNRYMTVTGNVYVNAPIAERPELLAALYTAMGASTVAVYDASGLPQTDDDLAIYNRAASAENGATFLALWAGDLTGYPSQSEADQALTNLLQFYTKNRDQIKRLFMQSALGQRDKAKRRDYVDRNITKAFDNETPPVDLDAAANQLREVLAIKARSAARAAPVAASDDWQASEAPENAQPAPSAVSVYGPPPNLLGEIAQFIYSAAPHPVGEIALTGAIGFLAGVTGRTYNISGAGLNLYILLLAASGTGKDAISSGINLLTQGMMQAGCGVAGEFIGPSMLPSGQGIIRHLSKPEKRSCVSIIGEFGLRMQRMMAQNAPSSELTLKTLLLDVYGKSGFSGMLGASSYSDSDKNIAAIARPAYSIIGESTQTEFYKSIEESSFASGLIPRFTVIEYDGPLVEFNEGRLTRVPERLASTLASIGGFAMTANMSAGESSCVNVALSPEAKTILKSFRNYVTSEHRKAKDDAGHEVWSRAWLKAAKFAALASFTHENFKQPTVSAEAANWACAFVDFEIRKTLATLNSGKLGVSKSFDSEQLELMRSAIGRYLTGALSCGSYERYKLSGAITKSWIDQRCIPYAAYRNDRLGSNAAVKKIITQLVEHGALVALNGSQAQTQFGSSAYAYSIANASYFLKGA